MLYYTMLYYILYYKDYLNTWILRKPQNNGLLLQKDIKRLKETTEIRMANDDKDGNNENAIIS